MYRPALLSKDLRHDVAEQLLQERGYCTKQLKSCVVHLIKRLREFEEFPHEIGLFLGYPPEDVNGFINNKAGGCKITGCWKVYGDAEAARKTFERYRKCTKVYCKQFANGRFVRNLYEDITIRQARRLFKMNAPTKEELITILAEDLEVEG